MQSKRETSISYIRLVSTLMIVILHIIQRLSGPAFITDWLNLGVVFFFCISAYLYAGKTVKPVKAWLKHRCIEIILPSIIVAVCTIFIYSLFVGSIPYIRILYVLLSGLGLEAFVPDGWMMVQLWFLTYILVCYLAVPFLQKIDFRSIKSIFITSRNSNE